jgi:hypothetical protein
MPAPKGDEYWAKWAYGFCQVAQVSLYPNRDYGRIIDMKAKSVAAMVHRMRERGFMIPKEEGTRLTPRAEEILQQVKFKDEGLVAFDLRVRAKSKEEALAEAWDVISQLEHWDPRAGEPFRLAQARHRMLGAEDVD